MLAQQVYYDNNDTSSTKFESRCLHFENKLLNELEDLDDPLETFLEYINFINDQDDITLNTKLKQLLERCINYILILQTYNNDPRFVKIWLYYLNLFLEQDNLIQLNNNLLFMFLHGVGTKLTMFYIEWADVLWNLKQFQNALLILKYGMKQNARPIKKFKFILQDLQDRLREMNLLDNHNDTWQDFIIQLMETYTIPTFITQIPSIETSTSKIIRQGQGNNTKTQLQIFEDATTKFNTKIQPIYQINKVEGRLPEKIDCNFDLIYNEKYQYGEISFEQLFSTMRGPDQIMSSVPTTHLKRNILSEIEPRDEPRQEESEDLIKKRKLIESLPSSQPPIANNKSQIFNDKKIIKDTTIEYKTHTSILPLKEEEDNNLTTNNTNTITFFSKDAMNEVYSMFNQNLNENNNNNNNNNINNPSETITTNILNNDNNTTNRFALYENTPQDLTRPNIDDLTEVKTLTNSQQERPFKPLIDNNNITEITDDNNNNNNHDNMYAIEEKTETSIHTPMKSSQYFPSQSSPFLSQPGFLSQVKETNNSELVNLPMIISHPLSVNLRHLLLSNITPPLSAYDSFYKYDQNLNMSRQLEKIHKLAKVSNKKLPIINFAKINKFYCIHSELGRGGYAVVYLAESDDGSLNALKVENPANSWEYYILRQIEMRLHDDVVLQSIINANSLHFFQDESYLVLNYANQGTVLDLINLYKEEIGGTKTLDELICMFITIELIKVIEKIHEIGIIHGDLKPDNCMIRFLSLNSMDNEPLGDYNKYGENGWDQKGICLIDFGRSFDLNLFQQGTQFKADWITDEQDCYEMRHGLPWSYECDYYGLAGIIHCMLFGTFIETTVNTVNHKLQLKQALKRSWQKDIWSELFDMLLNSGEYNLPITSGMKLMRLKMEDYILNDRRNTNKLRLLVLQIENELSQVKNKYYIPKRG